MLDFELFLTGMNPVERRNEWHGFKFKLLS
jgi:hypothetical protein